MIKSILGIRWVGIGIKIVKWGSIVAVIGYLSWAVYSSYQLRKELAVVEQRVTMIQSTANELQRRMKITEEELDTLNRQRRRSRVELEQIRDMVQQIDRDTQTEEEIQDLYQQMIDEITRGLHQISNN